MKLTKPFLAVPAGEIYPVQFEAGDDCPPEHEDSAREQGCLDPAPSSAAPAKKAAKKK